MQWLIDLIKEWVQAQGYALQSWVEAQGYLATSYVDRGDPDTTDFKVSDFIRDLEWHELDLSAIVPAGAKAVVISLILLNTSTGQFFILRRHGNFYTSAVSHTVTQAANIPFGCNCTLAVDADRKIDYCAVPDGWTDIFLTVKGWWL